MSQLLDACSALLLLEPADMRAAATMSLGPGRDPVSLSALGCAPAAGQGRSPGPDLLEEVSVLNMP